MITIPKTKTIIEPFKIKTVESLPMLTLEERTQVIKEADYNTFFIPAKKVTFDLLTDSGTSAMSNTQWAGIMMGDESYAGSTSFEKFEATVKDITHQKFVIPTHQGRSAEALLMASLIKEPGDIVIGNTHFDTTRANIEARQGVAIDFPCKENEDTRTEAPFKGNIDLQKLENELKQNQHKVKLIILTVTNNSVGGQPVSMENISKTSEIAKRYQIPFYLDAARFAENAYFIKIRETGYANKPVKSIAQDMFSFADGVLMSSKKDAFANIGGFLALNNEDVAMDVRNRMVITEGFPTYGGLAGRDLEALAIGLQEITDENYLAYRIRSIEYFGQGLENAGFKTVRPYGGHAVYIDAKTTLPHLKPLDYPGHSLSVAFYQYVGIRSVEIGSVMLGSRDPNTGEEKPALMELVRLAMPRRVYTQSHVDYMIEVSSHLAPHVDQLPGYEFTYQAPALRHFTARFKPKK